MDEPAQTAAEPAVDPVVEAPAPPLSAKAQLRAFEDDVFGEKVSRMNGEVERGLGSPYSDMTPHQKARHAALEKLVAAEKGMADASAMLAAAEAAHAAAMKASDDAAKTMDDAE